MVYFVFREFVLVKRRRRSNVTLCTQWTVQLQVDVLAFYAPINPKTKHQHLNNANEYFFLKVFLHMFVCYYCYHSDIEWAYFSRAHLRLLCIPIYLPSSEPMPTVHNCLQCDNCDFVLLKILCAIIFGNDYRSILWHLSVFNLLKLPMDLAFGFSVFFCVNTEYIFIGQLADLLLFRKYLPRAEWSTIYCLKRK